VIIYDKYLFFRRRKNILTSIEKILLIHIMKILKMKSYKFELDGSISNQFTFYPFLIDYMKLVIEPNLS